MPLFHFKTPSVIGLEITSHEVRFVQLKKTRKRYTIMQVVREPLPANMVAEGKIIDWHRLTSIIAEWVRLLNWEKLSVVILLPAAMVRIQHIQLSPHVTDETLASEIDHHIKRDLPGIHETVAMDYHILKSTEMIVAVTRQDYLLKYINCINQTGLKVKIVDIDIYALIRFFIQTMSLSLKPGESYGLIFMTAQTARLILFNSNEIFYHQDYIATHPDHFLIQWRTNMQMGMTLCRQAMVQTLWFYGPTVYFDAIKQELSAFVHDYCQCHYLFHELKISAMMDMQFLDENEATFVMSCGAVMQDIPRW